MDFVYILVSGTYIFLENGREEEIVENIAAYIEPPSQEKLKDVSIQLRAYGWQGRIVDEYEALLAGRTIRDAGNRWCRLEKHKFD